jgi:hypothetical protein
VRQKHRLDDAYLTLRKSGYDEAASDFDFMPCLPAYAATAGAAG